MVPLQGGREKFDPSNRFIPEAAQYTKTATHVVSQTVVVAYAHGGCDAQTQLLLQWIASSSLAFVCIVPFNDKGKVQI